MYYVPTGESPKPEKYKDYKHRTREKFLKRAKEMVSNINSCSLKGEDKIKLFNEISAMINPNQPANIRLKNNYIAK